jgi:hypothetical protein
MMVNYPEYFVETGYKIAYYDPRQNQFASQSIMDKIKEIQGRWKDKFPLLDFKTQNLKFDNIVNFNFSFTNELELLNTDPK